MCRDVDPGVFVEMHLLYALLAAITSMDSEPCIPQRRYLHLVIHVSRSMRVKTSSVYSFYDELFYIQQFLSAQIIN